jgi:hypothetical protein
MRCRADCYNRQRLSKSNGRGIQVPIKLNLDALGVSRCDIRYFRHGEISVKISNPDCKLLNWEWLLEAEIAMMEVVIAILNPGRTTFELPKQHHTPPKSLGMF